MKKLSLIVLFTLFVFSHAFAQLSSGEEKTVEKSIKLANKGEFDKAADELKPLLVKYNNYSRLWNLIIKYKHESYVNTESKNLGFSIEMKGDSTGKQDSLVSQLAAMLNGANPKNMAFSRFVNLCREAERLCELPDYASTYLRNYFVDDRSIENVPEKAIKFYNKAETAFENKNYDDAMKYYDKALEEYPQFYKATLYLGDTYYVMNDYGMAASYFRKAAKLKPGQLEPHKYLVDALVYMDKENEAMEEALATLLVYPDATMFWKVEDIATLLHKNFERNWIPRGAPVNIASDTFYYKESIYETDAKGDKKFTVGAPWTYYQEAWDNIKEHTDKSGILKEGNPVTKHRYAETYCWEYMLQKSEHESLAFARKMEKENMLDCYVLVSLFNFDLYPQTKDLIQRNPDKVKGFLNSLLVEK